MSYDHVLGIHDMIVHDYGPGRVMLSLHAEVPADGNLLILHDMIDNIEHRLHSELRCEAVIHMDPVVTDDARTNHIRQKVSELLTGNYPEVRFHDFRIVEGPTHTNIIFDVVIPYGYRCKEEEITAFLQNGIHDMDNSYYAVIQVDKAYT